MHLRKEKKRNILRTPEGRIGKRLKAIRDRMGIWQYMKAREKHMGEMHKEKETDWVLGDVLQVKIFILLAFCIFLFQLKRINAN